MFQELLLEKVELGSIEQVSCGWVKENEGRWRQWVPIDTSCQQGFGMMDSRGAPVQSRADAVTCGLCPAGTASTAVQDEVF